MHSQASATPGWCACGKRCGVTARFHERSDLGAFLPGQSVKVTQHNCWSAESIRPLHHRGKLLDLSANASMGINVRVEESQLAGARQYRYTHCQPRAPGA